MKASLQFRRTFIALAVAACFGQAQANPTGLQVVSGQAVQTQVGNTLSIANSANAILNWGSFSIAASEVTRFVQPNAQSAVLNRVVGSDPSQLLGGLLSNGKVFLVNPAGILVGQGARIDVAGFVASTLNLTDANFLAGNLKFDTTPNAAKVINQGSITTPTGGQVFLVGSAVENSGIVAAPNGQIVLAAGQTVQLIDTAAPGLKVEITGDGSVTNLGKVIADTGRVGMVGALVRNGGSIDASSAVADGGRIFLKASRNISLEENSAITATSQTGSGGQVDLQAAGRIIQTQNGVVDASGLTRGGNITLTSGLGTYDGAFLSGSLKANAMAGTGGNITLTGNDLYLAAATLEARGTTLGGQIRIGGDFQGRNPEVPNAGTTRLNTTTRLDVSAGQGQGGSVVVWSNDSTAFSGVIDARGATAPQGGTVEVSSKNTLAYAGLTRAGTLLLDPKDITISAAAGQSGFQLVDPDPGSGNNFGSAVADVRGGNVLVTSPGDSFNQPASGAVYLFNGTTGALVSTLRGDIANSRVGSGGVLTSGSNFLVASPAWANGASAPNAGAVTWGSGATGVSGNVSSTNSLIGSSSGDRVGSGGITLLMNGNYLVVSPDFNGGQGAVTWGDGGSGISGAVSSTNSLVGTSSSDHVGSSGVTQVGSSGDKYLVLSPLWGGGAGAVTWGDGATGVSGSVSSLNSLVGSISSDQVGSQPPIVLSNGNYLIVTPGWNSSAGAVTWGDASVGVKGAIDASNSLVGSANGDQVGTGGITMVNFGGSYVVVSPNWSGSLGAVTWGSSTTGAKGTINSNNSLIGSVTGDQVGAGGVTALDSGNYVVASPNWNSGLGAATLGDGTAGITGTINSNNSLIGSASGDQVGSGGVTALSSGNYVVVSPGWNGSLGAATWGDGTAGITGTINSNNSLIGSVSGDQIGLGSVVALANGNYVVASPSWNGSFGAATWGNGSSGVSGTVSSANSMVGDTAADGVGSNVVGLYGGNYLIQSPAWHGGKGALTWGNGTSGQTGVVASTNSLVGGSTSDGVGANVMVVSNEMFSYYLARTPNWGGGFGAVTWGSGSAGVSGIVSSSNSLVGASSADHVGAETPTMVGNNNFLLVTPSWGGGAGAVTWGSGTAGVTGVVSSANSLVGSAAADGVGSGGITSLYNGAYVVASPNWNGGLGAVTWGSSAGVTGVVSSSNSLVGTQSGDRVGYAGVTVVDAGNYVVSSPYWANGTATSAGAVTWGDGSVGTSGQVSGANSLVGSQAGEKFGAGSVVNIGSNYLLLNPNWTNGSYSNSGRVDVLSGANGTSTPSALPQSFASTPSSSVTLSPMVIQSNLDASSNVVLQANNDIMVNSPVITNNSTPATPANLTLQAGRSILVNADIDTSMGGHNITLIANERAANGVVDADRDAGAAAITMAGGTSIKAGSGNVTLTLSDGAGLSNNTSSGITLADVSGSAVTITTSNGNIAMVGAGNKVTATTSLQLKAATGINVNAVTPTLLDSTNTSSGTFVLKSNQAAPALLTTGTINSSGGPLTVDAYGGFKNNGAITAPGGAFSVNTHSPLTINAPVSASGAISLTSPTGTIDVNSSITSSGDGISLSAYQNLNLNSGASLTTGGTGTVTAASSMGTLAIASGVTITIPSGAAQPTLTQGGSPVTPPAGTIVVASSGGGGAGGTTTGTTTGGTTGTTPGTTTDPTTGTTTGPTTGGTTGSTPEIPPSNLSPGTTTPLDILGSPTTAGSLAADLTQQTQILVAAVNTTTGTVASPTQSPITAAPISGSPPSFLNEPDGAIIPLITLLPAGGGSSLGAPTQTLPGGTVGGGIGQFGGPDIAQLSTSGLSGVGSFITNPALGGFGSGGMLGGGSGFSGGLSGGLSGEGGMGSNSAGTGAGSNGEGNGQSQSNQSQQPRRNQSCS